MQDKSIMVTNVSSKPQRTEPPPTSPPPVSPPMDPLVSEEDRIQAIVAGAASFAGDEGSDAFKFKAGVPAHFQYKVPPKGYVCHRCGEAGHWIKFCPTNGDPRYDIPKIKRAVGIPRSMLKVIKPDTQAADELKGVVRLPNGSLAKIQPDEETFKKSVAAADQPRIREETPVELQCPICELLLDEAVLIPCCGNSFCSQCKYNLISAISRYIYYSVRFFRKINRFTCMQFDG